MGDFAVTNVKETVMSFRIPSTKSIDFEDRLKFDFRRNQKVKIKNTDTGKTKTIKWKKAESLVESGQWEVCIED